MAEESITIYLPLSDDLTGDTADWEEARSVEDSLRVVLAETAYMTEESITIYLPLSDDLTGDTADWDEARSVEDSLRVVLAETMVGMLKVSRAEEGFCRFKITGPNADVIHKTIQSTLASSRLSPKGFVVLKY